MEYSTMLLDVPAWDLTTDAFGNIATTTPPYALEQDVASAVRLFLGELWWDTTQGVPYFQDVLGHLPPAALLNGYIAQAALTVSGVVQAQSTITEFSGRTIRGQVNFIDENGSQHNVSF